MTPRVRDVLGKYRSVDPRFQAFVVDEMDRLCHKDAKGGGATQVFVPLILRGRLVVSKHGSGAHGYKALEETLRKLRRFYFWPLMRRDTEAMIKSCTCQQKKGERKKQVGELQSMEVQRPGEKVVFDIFGPLPRSHKGNVYLLVMVDVGTREVMLEASQNRCAVGVVKALLDKIFLRGWTPSIMQSDLAKEFVSEVVTELVKGLGAEFRHSSP